jgi:uncharacterized membrane protein YfhO
MIKIRDYFWHQRMILLSFIIPGLILLGLFAKIGIFPFGSLTLLISDMNSQYVDFMAEYQRILHGNGSLLYSWHAGMGLNFLGLFAYYLSSPMNLLLFFFPEKNLLDAITLITTLKIAGCGLTFAVFLKTHFEQKKPDMLLLIFSIFYALMSYTIAYSFNIMWLDGILLLPLLCLMIDRLIHGQGWTGLCIVFSILFLSNYYIGYMVGIFSVIYFLSESISQQKTLSIRDLLKKSGEFFLSAILAAGISAFLLIPSYFVLKDGMGLMEQNIPAFSGQFLIADLFKKILIGSYDGLRGNLPYVFCGLLPVCCLPLFFFSAEISIRKKRLLFLQIVFLLISFYLAPLDFLWHAMDYPSWFPYRYAFILSFVLLKAAFEGCLHFNPTWQRLLLVTMMILSGLVILNQKMDSEIFQGRFLYINLLFLLIYAFAFFFNVFRTKAGHFLLLVLCILECWFNGDTFLTQYQKGYTKRADYAAFRNQFKQTMSKIPQDPTSFYRLEKTEIRTYNDPLNIGFSGISHFSSTASISQSRFLKKLGLDCYATWCTYSGGTIFSDSFLGIRYIMSDRTPNAFYLQQSDSIWENPFVFPAAFFTDRKILDIDLSETDDPVLLQNQILSVLDASEESLFVPVSVQRTQLTNLEEIEDESSVPVYRRIDASLSAAADYKLHVIDDHPYVLFIPNVSLNYNVWVNDEQVFDQNENYTPYLVNLGRFQTGDEVSIHIDSGEDDLYYEGVYAFSFDINRFSEIAAKIRLSAPLTEKNGDTELQMTFPEGSKGGFLLTSIPYDPGWKAKLDGTEISVIPVMQSLIGLEIPAGSKKLVLDFIPQGWLFGCTISIISLLVLLFFLIKLRLSQPHLEKQV